MKIGILTHPLAANYGGILQCYALTSYLHALGHETIVIQRQPDESFFLIRWVRTLLKALHYPRYYRSQCVDRTVNMRPFVESHFKRTEPLRSRRRMKGICSRYGLDAVIVGSDQVWRHDYAMNFGYDYFLDFVPDHVIKASYAASFGLAEWRYTPRQTMLIGSLLSRFRGISVREDEAVSMCMDKLGIKVEHMLDPTLLLSALQYEPIVSARKVARKYVFVYWLGDKNLIAEDLSKFSRSDQYEVVDISLRDRVEQCSVEDWLSYIKYADTVITDSFHGCAFSIIFQRPFVVYGNLSGGNGRLSSLFRMLGIEYKLTNPESPVDYEAVNVTLNKLQQNAEKYLSEVLKS